MLQLYSSIKIINAAKTNKIIDTGSMVVFQFKQFLITLTVHLIGSIKGSRHMPVFLVGAALITSRTRLSNKIKFTVG